MTLVSKKNQLIMSVLVMVLAGAGVFFWQFIEESEKPEASLQPSSTRSKSSGPLGPKTAQVPPAKSPTLGGLNRQQDYIPQPGDLSPEGFNWVHRDLALIYSGVVYEHNFKGVVRETVLKERLPMIEAYLETLRAIQKPSFDAWNKDHRLSFLINAYHAHILALMAVRGVDALGQDVLTETGTITLFGNNHYSFSEFIDQEIRSTSDDPRVFLTLRCFAEECPEFRNTIYNFKNLEAMLASSTYRFVQDDMKNRFDVATKTATLSHVFKDYGELFAAETLSLTKFLASYVNNPEVQTLLNEGKMRIVYSAP